MNQARLGFVLEIFLRGVCDNHDEVITIILFGIYGEILLLFLITIILVIEFNNNYTILPACGHVTLNAKMNYGIL